VLLTKYYSGDQIEKNEMSGHVARMGEGRGAYRFFVGKPEGKSHLKDPAVGGSIVLKWIFRKRDGA